MINSETPYLEVNEVSKFYGAVKALEKVSFTAARGEFISILGPSGCGKTTALRVVAGLESQDSGSVCINGKEVSDLPVARRNVGIVFQSYALFPNLTAAKNIAYGLQGSCPKNKISLKVKELMQLVGLEGLGRKFPAQLSGGQQQRVALARAMALSPDLLLLDEPLSALDAKVRVKLRSEIRNLQQRLGVTTIMVTHDQEEALTMADKILVMNNGRLEQEGPPSKIYEKPATPFVASFIGSMNFMDQARKIEPGMYSFYGKTFHVENENGASRLVKDDVATLAIRPEDILIDTAGKEGQNWFKGSVENMEYRGSTFRLDLCLDSSAKNTVPLTADVPTEKIRRFALERNHAINISLPADRLMVYEPGADRIEYSDRHAQPDSFTGAENG